MTIRSSEPTYAELAALVAILDKEIADMHKGIYRKPVRTDARKQAASRKRQFRNDAFARSRRNKSLNRYSLW